MSSGANVQVIVPAPAEDLQVVTSQIPACPDDGILLKTEFAGICHSDIHLWQNKFRVTNETWIGINDIAPHAKWPVVLGHEIAGRVHALGANVSSDSGLSVGDRVVVFAWVGCDDCDVCRAGQSPLCEKGGVLTDIGVGIAPGGYQSYVPVPSTKFALKLPASISSETGCMLGCSALTTFHVCQKIQHHLRHLLPQGICKVLLIGAGGLGLWCLRIARAMFGSDLTIFVADITEEKLATAKENGADQTVLWPISSSKEEVVAATKQAAGGGLHAVVDFVGNTATADRGAACLAKGGMFTVVGLAGGVCTTPLIQLTLSTCTVGGLYVGSREQLKQLIDLADEKQIEPPPYSVIKPEEANEAIHLLQQGKVTGRSLIKFE